MKLRRKIYDDLKQPFTVCCKAEALSLDFSHPKNDRKCRSLQDFLLKARKKPKIRFSCFQRHGLDKLLGSHGYFNLLAPTNAALGRSQLGSRKVRIPYTDSETTTVYSSGRLVPVLKRCVPHRVSINRG